MWSMHVANTLLIALLVGCGGAVTDSDVSNTAQGAVKQPTTGGGDALACAQAKDYAAEAQRVGSSVQNPLTDNFEVHNEYERQASAARQEAQRLRTLAAAARRSCEGTSAPIAEVADVPAAPPAANSSLGLESLYGTETAPPMPQPAPLPLEHAALGTLPVLDVTGTASPVIPADITVSGLRFGAQNSGILSLRGVVHAGAQCVDGLVVDAVLLKGGEPFDKAKAYVTVGAGNSTGVVWDFRAYVHAFVPEAMTVQLEAVGLRGTCRG